MFEPDLLADGCQMFLADAAEFGVMEKQIRQFPALLDKVNFGQAGDALLESVYI